MKRTVYIVAFLFFLTAWTGHDDDIQPPRADPPPTALSQQDQQEMLDRHNHWRREVGAPSLQWSSSLTTYAREWADNLAALGCNMVHREENPYGENLTRIAPRRSSSGQRSLQAVTETQIVDGWANEKQWYNYSANSCQSGQECGHYTQVVWADTREVGCAHAVCPDQSQIWVCNYDPKGNVTGQKPY